ncbi:MAG TPA: histidine phosphatase family protein [Trebonia sp.]|nr:histidine phosphatase family protein [Trebonia sp.]
MNHLAAVTEPRNRYYVMRHGQSMANVRGIIVSDPASGVRAEYGLSSAGREQVLAAAKGCGLPPATLIFSSDFSRAAQTADIVRECLGAEDVRLTEALRERCFGDWEGTSSGNYAQVWAADAEDPDHRLDGVEPASAVLDRVTAFVAGLEAAHADRDILLVSHGDTLQILQAGFRGMSPARHRDLPHLDTAEIRRIDMVGVEHGGHARAPG